MSHCENCGASFAPTAGVQEVTSVRILCPACARERQQRRQAGSATSSAKAAPQRAQPLVRKTVKAAPERGQSAARRATKAPPDESAAHGDHHAAMTERRSALAARKHRQTMIGTMSVGGMLLVGGIIGFVVWRNAAAAEAAKKEFQTQQAKVVSELLAYDTGEPEAIAKLLARAKETAAIWQGSEATAAIDTRLRTAESAQTSAKALQDLRAEMTSIEQGLTNVKTTEQLEPLIHQLGELRPRTANLGPEILAAFRALHDRALATLVNVAATETAAVDAAPSLANLANCQRIGDDLGAALDEGNLDAALRGKLQQQLVDVEAKTTALASKLAEQQTGIGAWQDLTGAAADWRTSQTPGFELVADQGALSITGPTPEHKGMGMATLQKHGPYRDFEVDLEFKLDSGSAALFLRLGRKADSKQVPVVDLKLGDHADGAVAVTPNETGKVRIRLVGNTLAVQGEGKAKASFTRAVPPLARKGSIAIATTPGSKLQIVKLAVRELP